MNKGKGMKMDLELLKIASSNLESAKILYKNGKYAEAAFCFQQSVEKSNKALGIIIEKVGEDDVTSSPH